MRTDKRRTIRLASIAAGLGMAATAALSATGTPAFASGSRIDIGYTVYSGGYVRGSGSATNNGDYTNVCVVIMSQQLNGIGNPSVNESQTCVSATGYHNWSAPSVPWHDVGSGNCYAFWTRITAYVNGRNVANKNSNTLDLGSC